MLKIASSNFLRGSNNPSYIRQLSLQFYKSKCSGICLISKSKVIKVPKSYIGGFWKRRALPLLASQDRINTTNFLPIRLLTTEIPKLPIEGLVPIKETIPKAPIFLSILSLLPLAMGSIIPLFCTDSVSIQHILQWQNIFGIGILSFFSSVHWGLAMAQFKRIDYPLSTIENMDSIPVNAIPETPTQCEQMMRYLVGILPTAISFITLTQSPTVGTLGLIFGTFGLSLFDLRAHKARLLPSWYIRLRVPHATTTILLFGINLINIV